MIYLKKGQKLFNNEGMVVSDPTGYYEDGAIVTCAMYHLPDKPICGYEAKYIAYGDNVYTITDEEKLMEEIKKFDPETLLGKTKEDIAVDKMVEKIQAVDIEKLEEEKEEQEEQEEEKEEDVEKEEIIEEEIKEGEEKDEEILEEEVISNTEVNPNLDTEIFTPDQTSAIIRKNKKKIT